jgi:hypothetical protein
VVQPSNRSPLGFEVQTKKSSWWFWDTNHQIVAADFEAKTGKPSTTLVWGSTKKPTTGFEAKPGEIVTTNFEAKLEKTVITDFEAKTEKTVAIGFEA